MFAFSPGGNPIKAALAGVLALALSGCATGISDDDRIIQLTPRPVEAADFVKASRPPQQDYISVASPAIERKVPLKSKEELARAEAGLAAKAAHNRASATRARPKSALDGRIEPGYRPPRAQPVPESTWNGLKANPSPARNLRKAAPADKAQ